MKKKLAVLTALLVLGAVVLGTAYRVLQSSMKQVEVEYATQMGDPTAAEGLELKLNSSMENRLFWETTLDWGSEPETEFSYFRKGKPHKDSDYGLHIWNALYGASYGEDLLRETNHFSTYEEWELDLFQDVSSRTKPGTKRTEVVDLSDYVEMVPVQMWLTYEELAGRYGVVVTAGDATSDIPELRLTGEFIQELERAFQFPISPDTRVAVSVEKDGDGEVSMVELGPAGQAIGTVVETTAGNDSSTASCEEDRIQIDVLNAVGQQYDYFVIETESGKTGIVDYSHIPGGYGVYRMPLHTGRPLTMEDVEMVCPLDPERSVREMEYNDDESQLLITTAAGGEHETILILDVATGQKIQELPKDYAAYYYAGPDFLVQVREQELTLLLPDELGQYRPVWTVDTLKQQKGLGKITRNGTRLAVVGYREDWQSCLGGKVTVEIYDQTGPLFAGTVSFSNFWPTQSIYDNGDGIEINTYIHADDLFAVWK